MIELRPYQQELLNKARESYKEGYQAPCIVAPCGSGKSVIIAEIARLTTNNNNRVLFLVHRKELIDQIKETFEMVGVDLSLVTFGMVQTVVRNLDKTPKPQLIITDENHHGLANSYQKIYDYFDDVKRLGFTATPIRLNGKGLGDVNDILIETVDAEWLIDNHYLAPYKYYAPTLIDKSNLKLNSLKEYSNQSVDDEMKRMIYGDVIKHYRDLANGTQAIAYCHNVEASKRTAEAFNNAGITAKHIDGKTPKNERDDIIQQFRDKEVTILCNVDLIGEGFDVPDCSTVIMLRPTQSLSLFIQQAMRGMRYKPNKTAVIIDHVDNASTHGLPDMEREWSLKGKKSATKTETTIRQCEQCYAVYDPTKDDKCPMCGFKPKVEERQSDMMTDYNAELKEVTKDDFKVTLNFKEPKDCNTMQELYDLAEAKGYKPGWAYYQGKLLGFIN